MIDELLNELVQGFENKGVEITSTLNSGLKMYMWSNGCLNGRELDGLYFRDNGFLSIEDAKVERDSLVPLYAFEEDTLVRGRSEYKKWVPFAGFNGVINLVVCGEHIYGDDLPFPVISVGGGDLNIEYDSLTSMLRTNIDWVNHSEWVHLDSMPTDVEKEIWTAHNPGIWERRDRAFQLEVQEARDQ